MVADNNCSWYVLVILISFCGWKPGNPEENHPIHIGSFEGQAKGCN